VELDRVTVDGHRSKPWVRIEDGEIIEAYSRYPLAEPPTRPRFLLDVHLARLARYLRLFGFDTAHHTDAADPQLVAQSLAESRILLTRDRGLLMRGTLVDGSYVRATEPRQQIVEVVERFALTRVTAPLIRCLACNGSLRRMPAADAVPVVPASVAESHTDFTTCEDCGRVYWKGSHYRRLLAIIEETGATR